MTAAIVVHWMMTKKKRTDEPVRFPQHQNNKNNVLSKERTDFMRKKTIIIHHNGEKVKYRYSVSKGENACSIHIENTEYFFDNKYEELDEIDVMITKTNWYCIAFPDIGTASAAYKSLGYATVADIVHDAGFYNPDTEAITRAIMDAVKDGF